jgi:integrase
MWMEKCVIPTLGSVKLAKVTKLQIQRLYGSLSSDHSYSRRTITYVHQILSQALKAAVSDRLIAHNPCDGARASIQKEEKTEMVALTFEQTRDLIEKTRSEKWGILWRLLVTTGLRPQEALALKWADVSKTGITVNRALVRQKNGTFEPRDFHTKRPASRRQVSISEEMAGVLEEHRKEQLKVMMKSGVRAEWVFTTREGTILDPRTMRRHWEKVITRHGIPDCRVYDLRHTHLTHLLSSGVNPKAVASRAGHSNPTVLLTTYAHVLPEVAVDAANIVERRMRDVGTPSVRNVAGN